MAAATAGFLLARINSHFVSAIEVDRSEEYAKAMERQKNLRKELDQEQQTRAADPAKRLEAITGLLSMRLGTHARTRRTLNLVWACQSPPPITALADLVNAGRPANVKLLLVGPVPPGIRCIVHDKLGGM